MHMSVGARQSLKALLNNPHRAETISRTMAGPQPSMHVPSGFLPIESGQAGTSTLPAESPGAGSSTDRPSVADVLMHKRASDLLMPAVEPPAKRHRKKRTCQKCGKVGGECPGAGNRKLCKGKCQDCGNAQCDGRESKKGDLPCPQMRGRL
jgi:hypothetical protein